MMPKVVVDELFRLSGGRFSDRQPPERVPRSAAPPPRRRPSDKISLANDGTNFNHF